ncbi:hypothetical protein ALC56_00867 [Trachymyrmex septentrionalis]|uniref:Uncharacterized protein n=1 Tax=Trachymyrmex septentrionalis TaxID=34720 RepID=A0A195FWR6_9HYME|nr:hypothetical protein ALC56_00867 [Trachymyrmex septentrionalis]
MRIPYVRYSRVPIAMWYPLMRVHVLPSVCESPGKTRPTCQYDESPYEGRDRGACIIWGFLGTANE